MSDIYGTLNVASRALLAQQKAISVTGHNIANANTPGFSRQRVNMETNEPLSFYPGQMGTGVRPVSVQRVYDQFIGVQVNHENQSMGRWSAQKGALERIEMILDESTGYGLNQRMSEFWNSWEDISNNPGSPTERVVMLNKAELMLGEFHKIYQDIEHVQKEIDISISGTMEDINFTAQEIAVLNDKISQTETGGQDANDYRDKRDLLLKELSSMIDITTFENEKGMVTALVGRGRPLVENIFSWNLSAQTGTSEHKDVVWQDNNGNSAIITQDISGGKLKGWIETRDVKIPEYLNSLDILADSMINEVNNLHEAGLDLNGIAGESFFTGSSASDIAINTSIVDDVNLVAAASAGEGVPGGNGNAIDMANLKNRMTMSDGHASFNDYYNSLVSDIGSNVKQASINVKHETEMLTHLENYRESISGVSLDEEMVNLVKFQHAYDASAKLISTIDELLTTLINMV